MELGNSRSELQDLAANGENQRAMVTVVNVFSYGFIILISLISMTNVFNTISTSIALRRREFAMLRSVGLTQRGFARMMDYECIIYGAPGAAVGTAGIGAGDLWHLSQRGPEHRRPVLHPVVQRGHRRGQRVRGGVRHHALRHPEDPQRKPHRGAEAGEPVSPVSQAEETAAPAELPGLLCF